jgi:putative intracellular protease/amidase
VGKVIGAICHGVLVLARAVDPETGKSILYDAKVTALTKDLERSGYALTFWLLGRRYRTYECYVADEVRAVLRNPKNFMVGKFMLIPFTYRDGNLITSRWPLDAAKYADEFASMVAGSYSR